MAVFHENSLGDYRRVSDTQTPHGLTVFIDAPQRCERCLVTVVLHHVYPAVRAVC
jgi:hypothetical protein